MEHLADKRARHGAGRAHAARSPRRRVSVGGVLLDVAAAAGAVCILLVILAYALDITLILFSTGSMAPTIPTGSVAVVHRIPAEDIRVGDVVTVDQEGNLPVTHRVVTVDPGPTPDQRVLVLKGDANVETDLSPYTVSTVRRVIFSIPRLAYLISWLHNRYVLVGVVVGVAGLITWAFWPHQGGDGPDGTEKPKRKTVSHRQAGGAAALIATVTVALIGVAPPSQAASQEETSGDEYLTLTSMTDPAMSKLRPGETAYWQVGIAVHAPTSGTTIVTLDGTGDASLDLQLQVSSCSSRWDGQYCAETTAAVLTAPAPIHGEAHQLLTFDGNSERWFLIKATIPPGASFLPGSGVQLRVHAAGHGTDTEVSTEPTGTGEQSAAGAPIISGWPSGLLATTGANLWLPLLLAVGAVGLGLSLAGAARLTCRNCP